MNAARHAATSIGRPLELSIDSHHKPLSLQGIQLSPRGITFCSDSYMAPFTEVRVRLQLTSRKSEQSIRCDGVVVECQGNKLKKSFQVAVAFLNVPKNLQNEIRSATQPSSKTFSTPAIKFTKTAS